MDLRAERGVVGKMSPVKERQGGRAAGVGIFHVDAVKPKQRETDREGTRRPAVGASKNLLQSGIHLQRMVCPLSPVVEIARHDHRFTFGKGVGPFGQHFQLRLTMGFAQAQMNAADVDGQLKVGRGNAAIEQAAFFVFDRLVLDHHVIDEGKQVGVFFRHPVDLGAGFALATHDLEIRGAGELLGEDQSGQMETIGFSLYMELLENAVDALKAGREPSLEDLTSQQTEVELRMPSLLPDDFIPDVNTRLSFYKRIASAKNEQDLEEIKVELIDRFGRLPDAARNLLDIARLRQQAQKLGIRKLESNEKGGVIEFNEKNNVNPVWLIGLLQKQPQHFRLDGPTRLKFMQDLEERKTRMDWVRQFMRQLEENAVA